MGKLHVWRSALVLSLALLVPQIALADPDEVGPRIRLADRPRSDYSILHYWAPTLYQVRACVRPSYLDQYPPGPSPSVPATVEFNHYKTRAIPPYPSSPYANPASYYGRAISPP